MAKFRGVSVWAALLTLVFSSVSPAWAATEPSQFSATAEAAGLIIKYHAGVLPLAADGTPTAANTAGVPLTFDSLLDTNTYVVNFDGNLSADQSQAIANRVAKDPRVEAVELNTVIRPAGFAPGAAHSAIKAASAVTSLVAKDAWSAASPSTATASLSWKAPTNLYGAKLSGYQIEYSSDNFVTVKTRAGNTKTSASVSPLVAGVAYSFRVRAITKVGASSKLGTASSVKKATPTTVPTAPVITSGPYVTANAPTVTWLPQSVSEQGGLSATYTATATAANNPVVTCSTMASSCSFTGLIATANYNIDVTVANAHGSAHGSTEFQAADELYGKQWYLNSPFGVNAPKAWAVTLGSNDIVVAVLDGGVTNHPQLGSRLIPGYDFVSDVASANDGDGPDPDASDPGNWTTDRNGNVVPSDWHGTHVAGIIAAAADKVGTIGVAPNVRIQSVRVLGITGGTRADLIRGINWAAGLSVPGYPVNPTPAKVLNLSLGTDGTSLCDNLTNQSRLYSTAQALAAVKLAGVTAITAAGNTATDARYSYPGNCYPTINVGATGASGDRAYYSNFTEPNAQGVGVDISAPGGDNKDAAGVAATTSGMIMSLWNTGTTKPDQPTYGTMEGTSMAAPVVAGVVALLYSIKPTITFDEVWTVLSATVTPFKVGGQCASSLKGMCGVGIVNAGDAVAYLKTHM
ncbi:MAG: S8 family serine peptidase [Micrococcales bacterium]